MERGGLVNGKVSQFLLYNETHMEKPGLFHQTALRKASRYDSINYVESDVNFGICEGDRDEMKKYQHLIGKIMIAGAIVVAAFIIANAIEYAGGSIGSQIASALHTVGSQIN